jgi:hypothetical protein
MKIKDHLPVPGRERLLPRNRGDSSAPSFPKTWASSWSWHFFSTSPFVRYISTIHRLRGSKGPLFSSSTSWRRRALPDRRWPHGRSPRVVDAVMQYLAPQFERALDRQLASAGFLRPRLKIRQPAGWRTPFAEDFDSPTRPRPRPDRRSPSQTP